MKKWITLILAATFVFGAFATVAQAEEVSAEQFFITEGKIQATMLNQMELMLDEVLAVQETVGLGTNVQDDDKRKVSDLGKINEAMLYTLDRAKRNLALFDSSDSTIASKARGDFEEAFKDMAALHTQALLIAK